MISLKCSQCGREIEVSDTLRAEEIRCARCGQKLIVEAPDAARTEMGPSVVNLLDDEGGVTNQSGLDETFSSVGKTPGMTSYNILSPPRAPGELGWLDDYQVLRLLGQGGMGSVFAAVDTRLDRTVALKVMKPEQAMDEAARQRFEREAKATAAVKSDYIVTIHHVGRKKNVPYLAMEFLQGESLDKRLERQPRLHLTEILRISTEIARGLAAAHERSLIHRDIKPGNIWLEAPNNRVKILDFGLVKSLITEASKLTNPGMVMGTPAYMAPEQVQGEDVDARSDLFSLGCILYEMTTGETPFRGATSMAILMAVVTKEPRPPQELAPDLPPALAHLIQQLLAKKPQRRPATAQMVAHTLEAIATELGLRPPTPPQGMPTLLMPRRRWWAIALALLGSLVLGGVLAWLFATLFGRAP